MSDNGTVFDVVSYILEIFDAVVYILIFLLKLGGAT